MLVDKFGREVYYLRVSITDKCNLRCRYCMPPGGIKLKDHENLLRIEELERLIEIFVAEGINSVRVTGGEPLVHKGILPFISALSKLGLKDLTMTTNGVLLPALSKPLKAAGLNRLNISLDSLDPERFAWVTRGGDISKVLKGIDSALEAGLDPVKLNMVVSRDFNSDEVWEVANLAKERPLHVRFIELMPVGSDEVMNQANYVSSEETKALIEAVGGKLRPEKVKGCGPASVYSFEGWQGTVGFIHAVSSHFCATCNRLRLTSEGRIYPCLHSEVYVDVLGPLRAGATNQELAALLQKAVLLKPERSQLGSQHHCMHTIGG